jgi:hypothetical protein
MKKGLKKMGALVMALMIVSGMSAVAWAAPAEMPEGTAGSNNGAALEKTVSIEKELVVYNPDEATIAAPSITYNYDLTSGPAGQQVTDNEGVAAETKAGILPNVTKASVSYSNEDISAAADGASNKKTFTFDFSNVYYPAAGIYRYVVTESTNVDKAAAGITDGTISNVRTLDVYVRDAQNGESGRQIYGYVLFSDGTAKSSGFVGTSGDQTADQYYTYNVTLRKTLSGDSAMDNHEFPFHVDFTNDAVSQNVLLKMAPSGNVTAAAPQAAAASNMDMAPAIANGGQVKYIGIPANTQVDVFETNDVTGTTYRNSYTIDEGTEQGVKNITWDSANDANKSNTATVSTAASHTITFADTLELISPTGIVMRFAPYGLMMAAGIALLILAIRRKHRLAEEEF